MAGSHSHNSSSAYDLSLFEERAERRTLRVVKNKSRQAGGLVFGLSPLAVVCTAIIVVAVTSLFIFNNVMINELTAQINEASSNLAELQNENVLLQASLESKMSAKSIEEGAQNSLGLVKMDRNQIHYIHLEPEDVVEVADDAMSDSLVGQIIGKIKEYLG